MKLFAVLLGGRAEGCNTELHDVVFVVGNTLEETYPSLVKKWFGITKRLHIDSSIEMTLTDGHEITLSNDKPNNTNKLFFVNFGGYKPGHFGEQHQIGFYVGQSKSDVLARAKQELCLSLHEPHCDDNVDIDDVLLINDVDQFHIHLQPTNASSPLEIQSYYRRLDVPEILATV